MTPLCHPPKGEHRAPPNTLWITPTAAPQQLHKGGQTGGPKGGRGAPPTRKYLTRNYIEPLESLPTSADEQKTEGPRSSKNFPAGRPSNCCRATAPRMLANDTGGDPRLTSDAMTRTARRRRTGTPRRLMLERRRWAQRIEQLGGWECRRCRRMIRPGDTWELGHPADQPHADGNHDQGLEPEHRHCNRTGLVANTDPTPSTFDW